ncbi:MAG TPA: MFS transporter [Caulobacteraceae bacterium]
MFFVIGLAAGAWAPLVPFAKERLSLSPGALGLILLSAGAGSVVAMPAAGALAARFGCRIVVVIAGIAIGLVFPLLVLAPSAPALAVALLLFGAALGSIDCVINIQAIAVERRAARPLMSGFHALYSLAGIVGAALVSGMIGASATPLAAALVVAAAMLLATLVARPGLLAERAAEPGPTFALPHESVVLIGAFCFVVFLAEGSALDWSAVLLRTAHGAGAAQAGLAYAAFSATMTGGRLAGDRLVGRLGPVRTVGFGALLAAAGLAAAALAPSWVLAAAGYALVGAGCANIVPALFTLTGRQSAMPEASAVAAVSVLGYAGVLAGPAGIGLVANLTSLPAALLVVAGLLIAVAIGAVRLRPAVAQS